MSDRENNIMSVHNDNQQLLIDNPELIELLPLQATGCTAGDLELYDNVERAIECAIASEGPDVGPLGQSLLLAEVVNEPPISCMIDLITGPASDCDVEIPEDRRRAAFDAFTDVTGFRPVNLGVFFHHFTNEQERLLNINTFYIFFPTFVLAMLAVWLMVGFGWFDWMAGLFLSVLIFFILYSFSLFYRIQAHNFLTNQNHLFQNEAVISQSNFEDSIAYFPQGLFAVACAVTSDGDGWVCNDPPDPNGPTGINGLAANKQSCCSIKAKKKPEPEPEPEPEPIIEPPKRIKRHRLNRRKQN